MIRREITIQEQLTAVKKRLWPNRKKVAVIVDGAYVFIEARKQYGRNVNYAVLLREALEQGQLEKAVVFTFDGPKAKSFHNTLRDLGYGVQAKRVKIFADGNRKCNCDGEIITEMFRLAENGVHKIVLIAGDSDFESPLRYVKEKGKEVEVIGIRGSVAGELKAVAPVRYLDESMLMPSSK